MTGLTFYGSSDDLIEIEGAVREEFCVYGDAEVIVFGPSGSLRVLASYGGGGDGTWAFGVGQIEEGHPIPWPVRIETSERNAYSVALVIDCPDYVQVKLIEDEG